MITVACSLQGVGKISQRLRLAFDQRRVLPLNRDMNIELVPNVWDSESLRIKGYMLMLTNLTSNSAS